MPNPGTLLGLMFIPKSLPVEWHSKIFVRIDGQVVWTNEKTCLFGVVFLETMPCQGPIF